MEHPRVEEVYATACAALSELETTTLFSRLSSIFNIPSSDLQQLFLHSSDAEFEQAKTSLRYSCSSAAAGFSVDEGNSGAGSATHHVGGYVQNMYSRPTLREPVAPGDPLRDEYMLHLAESLLYALAHRDCVLVDRVVLLCPEIAASLKTKELSSLMHSIQNKTPLLLLLEQGVDANIFDQYGSTLLHKFVSDRNIEIVQLLLSYRADCNIEDELNQRTPLQLAALQGDFQVLYALVTSSKVPVKMDKPDFDGNSLLHLVLQSEAPEAQYKSLVVLLLGRGLSPGARNLRGETPLHYFCSNQALCGSSFVEPLLEMLLERLEADEEGGEGEGVNLRDADQCTPLIIACAHREWEVCKILLRAGADMNIPCSMSSALLTRGCDSSRSDRMAFESDCTAGDLVPGSARRKIFPSISAAQSLVPLASRDRCMNCATQLASTTHSFSLFGAEEPRGQNCVNCGRVVCAQCLVESDLLLDQLPEYLQHSDACQGGRGDIRVCVICHPILTKNIAIAKYW